VWMANWEFVDIRVDNSNVVNSHELQIINSNGDDFTDVFLENPDYQFFITAFDLEKANKKALVKSKELYTELDKSGYSLIMLTSALEDEIDALKSDLGIDYDVYNADDIVLKTMVRSSPGLVLFKDGVVI